MAPPPPPRAPAPPPRPDAIPSLLLFSGKGGTGKTTCAAALAVALAEQGERVRILSLDAAHNLGDVLGVALGDDARPISPGLVAREADLWAHTRARIARARASLRARYRYLGVASLDPLLSLIGDAPGAEEAAGAEILAIETRATRDAAERLIVDLPPSGQAWRLLSLPGITSRWTHTLGGLRTRILDRRRQLRHVLGDDTPAQSPDGSPLPDRPDTDPVSARIRAASSLHQSLAEQLARREETRLLAVLGPDRLSALEAERLEAHLGRADLALSGLVWNRAPDVTQPPPSPLPHLRDVALPDLSDPPVGPEALLPLGQRLLAWLPTTA